MARSTGQQFCAIRRDDETLLRPRQQARRRKKKVCARVSRADPAFTADFFPFFILQLQNLPCQILSFFFLLTISRPPGGMLKQKNSFTLSVWKSEWRREWDLNPRAPKGHRLTGEPIPDMGPRARQTARYQAPESRLNWATFHRLFSLLESARDANSRNPVCETRTRIAPKEEAWACFLRRLTRVAMGASQPTTLNGRMAVLAPGGRHP